MSTSATSETNETSETSETKNEQSDKTESLPIRHHKIPTFERPLVYPHASLLSNRLQTATRLTHIITMLMCGTIVRNIVLCQSRFENKNVLGLAPCQGKLPPGFASALPLTIKGKL